MAAATKLLIGGPGIFYVLAFGVTSVAADATDWLSAAPVKVASFALS